jgi:hypothetical protein
MGRRSGVDAEEALAYDFAMPKILASGEVAAEL